MTVPTKPDPDIISTGTTGTTDGSYISLRVRNLRHGKLGILPVLLALVLIALVFQTANSHFLTPLNLTNLVLQVAATGTISIGVFLVLLLGEIDLSVGSVSGVCASVLAVLAVNHHFGAVAAIVVALVVGALIGATHGVLVTRFGVPAFVVTLAGLIGWQGLQLYILGNTGTINLPISGITKLTSTFLSPALSWIRDGRGE